MREKSNTRYILLLPMVIGGLFVFLAPVYAQESCEEIYHCSDFEGDAKDKCKKDEKECKKLEEKAEAYQKIVDLKQKQKSTLGSQINNLSGEIQQTQEEIEENKEKIHDLNGEVKELNRKIDQKKELLKAQKELLAEIIRVYYENRQEDALSLMIRSGGFASYMSQGDFLTQTGSKIQDTLREIKSIQKKLEEEIKKIEDKKGELVEASSDLEDRNSYLQGTKNQKNTLLIQTQGEEAKYKKKLKKIEEQKQELLGDLDKLYNENYAVIEELSLKLKKPKSGLASTSWYFSQKDSRWKNTKIGNSDSKMKDYGCAISSVSMVMTYHGKRITPKSLAKKPIFYWDLISWPSSSSQIGLGSGVSLISNTNHRGVNWSTIKSEIKKGNPVIVFISAKGKAGHYVVVHGMDKDGEYVVHDPYFGANIFLDSSMKLLSKLYGVSISKKSIDQLILYR
jgi:peptidoglycan hydrolase CwlO-like protein